MDAADNTPALDTPLRILVLSPVEPFPPWGGWQVVLYNDIKFLAARGHELTVLADTSEPSANPRDMADAAHAEYFYKPKSAKWRQVLANLGQALPNAVMLHADKRLLARATELVRGGGVDVVLVEDVVMGHYAELLRQAAPVPMYLRGHNVSTTIIQRYYQSQWNPVLRYLGWRQYRKFAPYESAVMETFDCVSQISPIDAEQIKQMNPCVKSYVLYPGVDLDYFSMAPPEEREPNTIVHVGGLSSIYRLPPMMWFYEKVLPRVRQRHPRARLELAGYLPPCSLHRADPADVVVHGKVPDVRPFLAKGAVFISPLFVGSGIRIKLLNAMATGNAAVSTSVSAEGLPVTHGEDILIADDEEGFADCVCQLLESPELREKLGRRARSTIEERFGWPRIAGELEMHLRKAITRYVNST